MNSSWPLLGADVNKPKQTPMRVATPRVPQCVSVVFGPIIGIVLALVVCLSSAIGHEVRPAVADINVTPDAVNIKIRLTLEPVIVGINLDGLDDTDNAPQAGDYDALRAQPPEIVAEAFRAVWPRIRSGFRVAVGGQPIDLNLISVSVKRTPDPTLPRDGEVTLRATLPSGDQPVTFGWDAALGPIIVRQVGAGEDAYADFLTQGASSAPLPRVGIATESAWTVFHRYVVIGFEHIIPKGLDHILFVLGLFLLSTRVRPLIIQVSAFTVAHTVTLALAVLGWVTVPAAVVEPLIAASIVYVAVENIRKSDITANRTILVFAFGLLHGLGFASVLGDVGLDPARLATGLIGFNIGVEFGQLAVIGMAWGAVAWPFRQKSWYRQRIVTPGSLVIAVIGAYWFVERVFF